MLDSTTPPASPSPNPSFRRALAYWLKLGFISFGGPAGQIALIMVVALVGFVGFVGGLEPGTVRPRLAAAGGRSRRLGGQVFQLLAVVLLHLPGGPFIESTHGQLKFTAPLTAITAAIVGVGVIAGVIVNRASGLVGLVLKDMV